MVRSMAESVSNVDVDKGMYHKLLTFLIIGLEGVCHWTDNYDIASRYFSDLVTSDVM